MHSAEVALERRSISSPIKIGIVGLPNAGKSTLLNGLSHADVDPIHWLCHLFKSKKKVPVDFHVHAQEDEHVRHVDFLFHVIRAFEDPRGKCKVDPVRDLQSVLEDFRMTDIKFIERKIATVEYSKLFFYQEVKKMLDERKYDNLSALLADDTCRLLMFPLLTFKPVVFMVNMNEEEYPSEENKFLPNIRAYLHEHGIGNEVVPFSGAVENNVMRDVFRRALTIGKKAANVVNFFTAGPDEVKCWKIRQLTKAPQAAGVIHPDLEKGFIWAEVMKFEDLKELGSVSAVKACGKYRWEGKSYVVQEDDIIFFKAERPLALLKIGIVGLPFVGKSTLFNMLTRSSVPTQTEEHKEHLICAKDEKFDWLCQFFKPNRQSPAILEIHALTLDPQPGVCNDNLSKLSHIRDIDVIFNVLRLPSSGNPNLVEDMDNLSTLLREKDIDIISTKLAEYEELDLNGLSKDTHLVLHTEHAFLGEVKRHLEMGKDIRMLPFTCAAQKKILNILKLLTAKPVVYLVNMNEEDFFVRNENMFLNVLNAELSRRRGVGMLFPLCFPLEKKLAHMSKEESDKYREERNIERCCLVETGYFVNNVVHFYTAGPDNVTCWEIRPHSLAPQAAGVINPGYETGFICAMVMKFDDLKKQGSVSAVKAFEGYHQVGKTYVVQDGDIISFITVEVEVTDFDAKLSFRHSTSYNLAEKLVLLKDMGLHVCNACSRESNGDVLQEVYVKMKGHLSQKELRQELIEKFAAARI